MTLRGVAVVVGSIVVAGVGVAGMLHFAHSADAVDLPILVGAGPLRRVEVLDHAGRPIWRLIGQPGSELARLRWAEAPDSFRQEVPPPDQRPRPLVSGEEVTVLCASDTHESRHAATAIGPTAVRGGLSEVGPRKGVGAQP